MLRARDTIIKLCLRALRVLFARSRVLRACLQSHNRPYRTIRTKWLRTICTISTIPYVPYPRISPIQIGNLLRRLSYKSTEFVPKLGLPILYQILVHTTSTITTVQLYLAACPSTQSPQASLVTLRKIVPWWLLVHHTSFCISAHSWHKLCIHAHSWVT